MIYSILVFVVSLLLAFISLHYGNLEATAVFGMVAFLTFMLSLIYALCKELRRSFK